MPKRRRCGRPGRSILGSEAVVDEEFTSSEFFDARDLTQVRYEMVRRVRVGGETVSAAAAGFGFSRPSWYAAAAALDEEGLPGLLRARPGPRRAHKLSPEIVQFLTEELQAEDQAFAHRNWHAGWRNRLGSRSTPGRWKEHWSEHGGLKVDDHREAVDVGEDLVEHYEAIRAVAVQQGLPRAGLGAALLVSQGMPAWMRGWRACTPIAVAGPGAGPDGPACRAGRCARPMALACT